MNKKAKGDTNWLAIGAIVLVGYLMFAGVPDSWSPNNDDSDNSVCAIEDISFTPKITRMGRAGTSLSSGAHNYFITTDEIGAVGAGTASTVPVNYDMEVMFGENDTGYYTVVKDINTDCQDPLYESVQLPYADTSLNTYYIQNSDGTVNAAANEEAMGADDTFEFTVTLKAGSDEYFGNPTSDCRNVGIVEYDKTYILKASGDEPTAVPGSFPYKNATFDGANAFYIPKTADGEKIEFNVKLESTSTDPAGPPDSMAILHVYDCDVDKNEDTLALIEGVNDEDLNLISLANQTKIIYLS